MATARDAAFGLNVFVAVMALALAAGDDTRRPADHADIAGPAAGPGLVYPAMPFRDVGAGCEVVWTRLLSLMLGATVYTFSLILAVFLTGLGIGSGLGAFLAAGPVGRGRAGACQWLLTAAIAWTALHDLGSLPTGRFTPRSRQALVQRRARPRPLPLGRLAAGVPLGSELSAGISGGCLPRSGPRATGRRSLRGQHDRRHHRGPAV